MKIVRHIAPDMRQAMRSIREQLGEDAVILSSRKIPEGVEVTAAVDFDASSLTGAQAAAFAAAPLPTPPAPRAPAPVASQHIVARAARSARDPRRALRRADAPARTRPGLLPRCHVTLLPGDTGCGRPAVRTHPRPRTNTDGDRIGRPRTLSPRYTQTPAPARPQTR